MINQRLEVTIPTTIIASLSLILGCFLLFVLMFRTKKYTSDTIVMIIITLIDIIWSIQKIIYDSVVFVHGTGAFHSQGSLCQLSALTLGTTFRCSVWSLTTLAMMRFIHGCLRVRSMPIFWYIFLGLNICFNLSMGVYSILERLASQSASGVQCVSFTSPETATQGILIFMIVYLTFGSLIIVLCYFGSTIYINQSIRYLINNARLKRETETEIRLNRKKYVLFINFGVISIVYLLAFYPPIISYILKQLYNHNRTLTEDSIIVVFGQLPCLFNPILTIYLHPETNAQFFNLLMDIYDFIF